MVVTSMMDAPACPTDAEWQELIAQFDWTIWAFFCIGLLVAAVFAKWQRDRELVERCAHCGAAL